MESITAESPTLQATRSEPGSLTSRQGAAPVRVCFVIDRLKVAGTETQLLKLIAGLDRSRVAPFLCLLDGEDELSRSLEPDNCKVLRLGVRSLHHLATLKKAWRFVRFLRAERIEVVQMHFRDSLYFAAPLARLAGVRHLIRTRRDLGFWMRPVDRCLGRLYSRLVTATLANCGACRDTVIAQEGARPESVAVLENGIDLEPLLEIPLRPAAVDHAPVVGMVANIRPIKGPDVFAGAAAILAGRYPNVRFQLAGSGDEDGLRRLLAERGLSERFAIRGSVRDVPTFLGELAVAVLTSHSEGLSNAMLEYMAAGRPIVATAVGANLELIEDGEHGLLAPPGDPKAIANAVARLLDDRPFAERLGEAARQRTRQRFSQAAMVRRHEEFYCGLVR